MGRGGQWEEANVGGQWVEEDSEERAVGEGCVTK